MLNSVMYLLDLTYELSAVISTGSIYDRLRSVRSISTGKAWGAPTNCTRYGGTLGSCFFGGSRRIDFSFVPLAFSFDFCRSFSELATFS